MTWIVTVLMMACIVPVDKAPVCKPIDLGLLNAQAVVASPEFPNRFVKDYDILDYHLRSCPHLEGGPRPERQSLCVPEPATVILLGCGSLLLMRWRKNHGHRI